MIKNGDPNQVSLIKKTLSDLETSVTDSIEVIEINNDLNHYRSEKLFGRYAAAHCEYMIINRKTKICIRSRYISKETLYHEAGHAFHQRHEPSIKNKWLLVSNFRYRIFYDCDNDDGEKFPHSGILTRYGATDWEEDFAEWFQAIYATKDSPLDKIPDSQDERYTNKLKIIFDQGAINKKIYEETLVRILKNKKSPK